LTFGNERSGEGQSKNNSLACWLKNFKREYYGVKLTLEKLRTFCEIDWLAFGIGWPSEGLLYKVIVNRVLKVIVGEPGHPDHFLYIDCWQDTSPQLTYLKSFLEKACRVMVARVAVASKCREKCKNLEKHISLEDPEETPSSYVPLYSSPSAPSPPPSEGETTSDREAPAANTSA
jgi:hypothetical protein